MTTKITEQNISELANAGVNWQSVFTGDGSTGLTAVAGRGYFINTTSGTVTVTLPASPSAGDVVVLKDYARTWGTNAVSLASALMDGGTATPTFSTTGQTVTLVYMDGTKGWSLINEDTTTGLGALYISTTGGTVTESGDYKIHTFTGDGCFVVSCAGNPAGSTAVDYLVVAGGGGGAANGAGGGGGGGYRESSGAASGCYTTSPLGSGVSALPVSATGYPITVGAGGSASSGYNGTAGTSGSNSVFSIITSTGGGRGAHFPTTPAATGGSGGGGGCGTPILCGAAGNTPSVTPPQGNPGGDAAGPVYGAGGGATAAGANGTPSGPAGGAGGTTSISGSPTAYAGGGGGATFASPGPGGVGGGGAGSGPEGTGTSGTANTGGGGGGAAGGSAGPSGAGGSGIVVIRYKYQ